MPHSLSDRTGRALGTLDPVIYFENASGHILLAPQEIGQGINLPRRLFEERYKHQGYEWREAGTLPEVQRLQKRLVEQEQRILDKQGYVDEARRRRVHAETASSLRQRMASSSCSAWERDFIKYWLELTDSKQEEYTQRFTERNMYLQAVEFNSNHKIEDRMGE